MKRKTQTPSLTQNATRNMLLDRIQEGHARKTNRVHEKQNLQNIQNIKSHAMFSYISPGHLERPCQMHTM